MVVAIGLVKKIIILIVIGVLSIRITEQAISVATIGLLIKQVVIHHVLIVIRVRLKEIIPVIISICAEKVVSITGVSVVRVIEKIVLLIVHLGIVRKKVVVSILSHILLIGDIVI